MPRTRAATFDVQRDTILATAATCFAARGYPVASIADIARACGVSKALVYHYYRDKEQLLFAIADRYLDGLHAIVAAQAAEKMAPAARLRALIECFMRAYEHSAAQHRVLVQDVKYLSRAHRNRVNAKQRQVVEAYSQAVAAVAPQLAGTDLLKPVTMTLFGMINWTFTWLRDDGPLAYADMAPVVADLFLRGVGAVKAVGRRAGSPARDFDQAMRRQG